MKNDTFVNQFNEAVALINANNNATSFKNDKRVSDAFNDISGSLKLTHQAVALLVWALNNMTGEVFELSSIATQIEYSERTVSIAIDELEKHRYMVKVNDNNDTLDVTAKSKDLIINHYCFYKLLNG